MWVTVPVVAKLVIAVMATAASVAATWLQVTLARRALPRVWVEHIEMRDVARTLTAGGTLRPRRRWMVSTPVSGHVRAIDVRPGDLVRAGQRLLLLESGVLRTQHEAARASADAAWSEAARLAAVSDAAHAVASESAGRALRSQQLFERGLRARDERDMAHHQSAATALDANSARERAAEAALRAQAEESALGAALAAVDRLVVRSPADGVVAEIMVRVGQWVHEGGMHVPPSPLVTIESSAFAAEVVVDQAEARMMDAVALLRSGPGAEVRALVPLDATPPGARSGMSCTVQGMLGLRRSVVAVPNHALVELKTRTRTRPHRHGVWTIQDGVVTLQPISVGLRGDAYTEVVAGLAVNQPIVTGPSALLRSVRVGDAVAGIPPPALTRTPGAAARSSAGWGRCSSGPRH